METGDVAPFHGYQLGRLELQSVPSQGVEDAQSQEGSEP